MNLFYYRGELPPTLSPPLEHLWCPAAEVASSDKFLRKKGRSGLFREFIEKNKWG